VVQEYAFAARVLAARVERDLADAGVRVLLNSRVTDVAPGPEGVYGVTLAGPRAGPCVLQARRVFNCTYAGLNQMGESFGTSKTALKQEITELALLQPPAALQPFGITVMDGPFFSFMPFPARNLHSLSHVRYTPHLQWADQPGRDPYAELSRHPRHTRVDRMMRDAGRYVPAILQSTYVESIFEVKTILEKNESDDGRPILFERHPTFRGCYSVLGGKIDNLFDVLEKLDAEPLDLAPAQQAPT
jgi:glycine/D-amino acid oxidase-like deaminating enzyme